MKSFAYLTLLSTSLLSSGIALADHHGGGEMHHDRHGERMPLMFSQFDKNHDGRISRDEMREGMDTLFNEVDTNHDGLISREEMKAHHKAMHDKFHEHMRAKIRDHWKRADQDGDGALSRSEVDAAKLSKLANDFDKLDKNRDGKLTEDEIRAALPEHPER
mgnify:FL=1